MAWVPTYSEQLHRVFISPNLINWLEIKKYSKEFLFKIRISNVLNPSVFSIQIQNVPFVRRRCIAFQRISVLASVFDCNFNDIKWLISTTNSTSDYTIWTYYRSYFKEISANIKLQVYCVTCCRFYNNFSCRMSFVFDL
jgi:hypothetical protein